MFFVFVIPPTTVIYPLSLHDALPISHVARRRVPDQEALGEPRRRDAGRGVRACVHRLEPGQGDGQDRKSTRLNSSHVEISYAVFCLKKKNKRTLHKYEVTMN